MGRKGGRSMLSITERAALYIEKMPPSIQGSGGSAALFNVALALLKGFALSQDEAWPLVLRWNQTHCQPSWSEMELRHKLISAVNSSRLPGYLLQSDEVTSTRIIPDFEHENEFKARLRHNWPLFESLNRSELEGIARLRKLPLVAAIAAARSGFLSGVEVDRHRSFVIHETNFVQARRLDGLPFTLSDGRQTKAKNLAGSRGAFIGKRWLGGPGVKVLMVEGAIALLEALAAHEIVCPSDGWTIIAATSASSRFSRDRELLAALRGRFIRIVPDADDAGMEAAALWLADLENAGCSVDIRALPPGIKDLAPLVANPSAHAETLTALFQ